ncbi:putative membrane-associated kinase regulator 1 [Bidens hawaiensis]|uniref:putative membrane-associated kinase regulator 1 n=1 Tax=Bidens hawaiensis TaxID=980011 RepID=UPI00404AC106
MGHHHHNNNRKPGKTQRSQTLPSSPTHSSSSSDFEFTVSLSPRKSSATNLCPADDLFYKGQLLPLHLSPRISMVRTLLLSSSSTSSSARHSSDSHSSFSTEGCDSSRPSSVTDDDLHLSTKLLVSNSSAHVQTGNSASNQKRTSKYFSLSKFPNVFRKNTKACTGTGATATSTGTRVDLSGSSVKRMSTTAKEMIRKYLKKARPLYEKLSNKTATATMQSPQVTKTDVISHSFSGNLRYPRRRSCVSSCPSSMRSSPSHSGILCRTSVVRGGGGGIYSSNSSSMEELQSAIQGAIAHCKSSMTQNK